MTFSDDPWQGLEPPVHSGTLNARRVDAEIEWNFFWARNVEGHCLLVLQHSPASAYQGHLPVLRGIELAVSDEEEVGRQTLIFSLGEVSQREVFHRLCRDIVESTRDAQSEQEAVGRAVNRTWRWHHLLRGGMDGRLSTEQQKGLIGELLVVERFLLPAMSAADAMGSWTGPLGAPKDFEVGQVLIEAKARRGAAEPHVLISSEHQLDRTPSERLFLHVVDLERAPSDTEGAFSVDEVVDRVRKVIEEEDPVGLGVFESLLAAAGFRWSDDYSESLWTEGESRVFDASDEFPRIVASELTQGVTRVRYSISLVECERFRVEVEVLSSSLGIGRMA